MRPLLALLLACVPELRPPALPDDPGDDWDGDGSTEREGDCDDQDPTRTPTAPEQCNGIDDDCDGEVDEGLETTLRFVDADGDGYGDPATAVEDCAPVGGDALVDGDCDDADPDVSPEATEVCGDGVDSDCSGDELGCTGVLGELGTQLWGAAGDNLGASLALGALSEGGEPGVVLGALGATDGAGAVLLVPDPPEAGALAVDTVGVRLTGTAGAGVGRAVSVVAPGLVAVGAAADSSGGTRAGAVLLLATDPLPAPGPIADAGPALLGAAAFDRVGTALAAGALAPDGAPALLIGADDQVDPARAPLRPGGAWIVPLSAWTEAPGTRVSDAGIRLTGQDDEDHAGFTVEAPGDLDGDGIDDAMVGAYLADPAGVPDAGLIYVLLGPVTTDRALVDADVLVQGPGSEARFGVSMAAGDADGDGGMDLLLGAQGESSNGRFTGAAYRVAAADLDFATVDDLAVLGIYGVVAEAGLGTAVALGGDADGDGADDIAVGVGFAGLAQSGAVMLFDADATGTLDPDDATVVLEGVASGGRAGSAVALSAAGRLWIAADDAADEEPGAGVLYGLPTAW